MDGDGKMPGEAEEIEIAVRWTGLKTGQKTGHRTGHRAGHRLLHKFLGDGTAIVERETAQL